MEDYLEVLIFLAFAAFSLFTQWLDRKRKAATRAPKEETERDFEQPRNDDPPVTARPSTSGSDVDRPRRRVRPSSPEPRTPTFQDILRELTGQTTREDIEEYEDDYDLPPYLQEEKARQEELRQESRKEAAPQKITDKISLKDTGKRIEPIKLAKKKKRKRSVGVEIGRSLRHPKNAKRAVILSEILQRKHF